MLPSFSNFSNQKLYKFHVLRRQIHRDFRKPVTSCFSCYWLYLILIFHQLIVFFSKSLLRHPKARSDLQEMVGDTNFQRYLPETHDSNLVTPEEIKRHILCTGNFFVGFLGLKLTLIHRSSVLCPYSSSRRQGHHRYRHQPHRTALSFPL